VTNTKHMQPNFPSANTQLCSAMHSANDIAPLAPSQSIISSTPKH